MTSPTDQAKKDLLIALLSMDSYNQGYGAGIVTGTTQVGSANLLTDSTLKLGLTDTQSTGFYAAAYTTPDGTVISYRGTDASPDYTAGWPIALGAIENGYQSPQALEFYNAVTHQTYHEGAAANVTLTGIPVTVHLFDTDPALR